MEIWVYGAYSEGFSRLAIIDGFISLRVVRKYGEVSTLEMQLYIGAEGLWLAPGRWVYLPEMAHVFYVECAEITDGDGGLQASIRARGAECLLDRRVIVDNKHYTNKYTSDILAGEFNNIYALPERRFPRFTSAIAPGQGALYSKYSTSPGTYLSMLEQMCAAAGLGFKTDFNPSDSSMTLSLYKGVDFSAKTTSPVFSPELETIYDMDVEDSIEQMCNICYVLGESGEGGNPKKTIRTWQNGVYTGYDRFEATVSFSASSSSDSNKTQIVSPGIGESEAMSEAQYADTMQGFGDRTLAERKRSIAMTGIVNTYAKTYQLGVDYSLGDIVRVRSDRVGMASWQRLTAIDDQWTQHGYSRAMTLGSPLLGIGRLMRK